MRIRRNLMTLLKHWTTGRPDAFAASDQGRSTGGRARNGLPRYLAAAILLGLYTACSACEGRRETVAPVFENQEEGVVRLALGGEKVTLEVAADEMKRQNGLMRRRQLDPNRGMLFIYPEPKIMRFFMKNTFIPLSIAFLKEDGTITNIEKMKPLVESPSYMSVGYCRFAIEMNQGWFEAHGIKAGDRISLTSEILDYTVR